MDKCVLINRLLAANRLEGGDPIKVPDLCSGTVLSEAFEEDRLRITLSAPVRRLQQKTQVFPLDVRTSSRSRLTHSLEVQVYARQLVRLLVRFCESLKEYELPLVTLSENAALLHDVGNPPFGHFGEALIGEFACKKSREHASKLTSEEIADLSFFNGNAQGFRLINTIQRLNLSLGQVSAMNKYPFTVLEAEHPRFRGRCGVFLSESSVLKEIRERLGAGINPLAFIVELCDDLAYSLADLEDAFDNQVLDHERFFAFLKAERRRLKDREAAAALDPRDLAPYFAQSSSLGVERLRAVIAPCYLKECAELLAAHLEEFLERGELDVTRLSSRRLLDAFKVFESRFIYGSLHVESLELKGASYLKTLFESYGQLLEESRECFVRELTGERGDAVLTRLARRISRRPREAYLTALESGFSEMYLRIRLIIDYISGMTDTYAAKESAILSGTEPI